MEKYYKVSGYCPKLGKELTASVTYIFNTDCWEKGISEPPCANPEGTEKHTIFILTLIKKEKNHQSFYDSGGFFVRRNINCLFFRRKFLFFIH